MQQSGSAFTYRGPSAAASSDYDVTYDYTGLDDHIKRQGLLSQLRDAKFAANYSGRLEDAVPAGNQVRELVNTLRVFAPGTTERSPTQVVSPLVRTARESGDSKISGSAPDIEFGGRQPGLNIPDVQAPPGGGGGKPQPPKNARIREVEEANLGVKNAKGNPDNVTQPRKRKPGVPESPLMGEGKELYA